MYLNTQDYLELEGWLVGATVLFYTTFCFRFTCFLTKFQNLYIDEGVIMFLDLPYTFGWEQAVCYSTKAR